MVYPLNGCLTERGHRPTRVEVVSSVRNDVQVQQSLGCTGIGLCSTDSVDRPLNLTSFYAQLSRLSLLFKLSNTMNMPLTVRNVAKFAQY